MKKLLFILIASTLTFGLSGCKKTELDGEFAKYEGTWSSSGETMTLYENGRADYSSYQGATQKTITGGRLVINKGELKISAGFIKVKYNIDLPPKEDPITNYTTMTLDGEVFVRY